MILMYNHVCPFDKMPPASQQNPIEGWGYTIQPEAFRSQLCFLAARGMKFVSMAEYVLGCEEGQVAPGTVTVTFDDGWVDNFDYAVPILSSMGVPATIFVVSGELADVSEARRLNPAQLRTLSDNGITVGGHSRSHGNLTRLSGCELRQELSGCKQELEQVTGKPVDLFAYPGGRFNQAVVAATKEAGYKAACSVIGGGRNGKDSLFWLFRETFSSSINSFRDRLFLNQHARKLLDIRARRKLKKIIYS